MASSDFDRKMNNNAVAEVKKMRNIAMEAGQQGPFDIDASVWFKNATTRINLLKDIEDQQSAKFLDQINIFSR